MTWRQDIVQNVGKSRTGEIRRDNAKLHAGSVLSMHFVNVVLMKK